MLLRRPEGTWVVHSFALSKTVPAAGLRADELVVSWARDGVYAQQEHSTRIDRIDLETGRRTQWRRLTVSETAGVENVGASVIRESDSYAYTYLRFASHLAVLEGLR